MGSSPFKFLVSGLEWGNLPDNWTLSEATSVAVNSVDEIIVFNRGTKPIIIFDKEGNYLRSWGENTFSNAHGISVDNSDNIYCVDSGDNTVRKFDPSGNLIFQLGKEGERAEKMSGLPFAVPTQVAVDESTNDFYVADGYSNAKVHKWINLSRAACIYVDKRGKEDIFYVGEYFSGIASNDTGTDLGPRISIFNKSGKLLSRLGKESYGPSVGRFYSPHGICVDSGGNIYVAEVSYSDYGQFLNPKRELRSMQKLVKTN